MKTTIELSDALFRQAKRLAAQQGTTLRALVEGALRDLLERTRRHREFTLRDASVDGKGLSEEFRGAEWEAIRETMYEGRGG